MASRQARGKRLAGPVSKAGKQRQQGRCFDGIEGEILPKPEIRTPMNREQVPKLERSPKSEIRKRAHPLHMVNVYRRLILAFALVVLTGNAASAQERFATVDLHKVFAGYWKTKQADAALKQRGADMEKENKDMVDDYAKAKADYQTVLAGSNNQALSTEERGKRKKLAEDKMKEIKEKEDTIAQYERQARTTLEEQSQRMRDNILNEIRKVLNARAKAAGCSLVFDSSAESANKTPIIPCDNNENDLTESVLKELNATAPLDLPHSDEPPPKDAAAKKNK
jgi:Skp family chaperone for outer membrane proteins